MAAQNSICYAPDLSYQRDPWRICTKRFYAGGRRPEIDKLRLLSLQFMETIDATHRPRRSAQDRRPGAG